MTSLIPEGSALDARYLLGRVLGQGSMGVVYEAKDLRLTRRVAIKVMRDGAVRNSLGERLFREARAAASANHPAVVTVYGYGTDAAAGVSYVAMERLEGEDLQKRLEQQGPLPFGFVTRVGRDVADALTTVHAAGVIHRDLKPGNIFLATRHERIDDVKVMDFGLAKLANITAVTATGEVLGTPQYMAPEQMLDSKHVDARTDVYALGVTLFECLTGTRPFQGNNLMELATTILSPARPDVRTLRPNVPAGLAEVVNRAIRRSPSERFQSADAMRDAFVAL